MILLGWKPHVPCTNHSFAESDLRVPIRHHYLLQSANNKERSNQAQIRYSASLALVQLNALKISASSCGSGAAVIVFDQTQYHLIPLGSIYCHVPQLSGQSRELEGRLEGNVAALWADLSVANADQVSLRSPEIEQLEFR